MKAEEKQKFQKASDVTESMIKDWKREFKGVEQINVPLDPEALNGKEAVFYVRKPNRTILNALTRYAADKQFERANNFMIKNCVLGGDMQYLDDEEGDDDVYLTLLEDISNLIQKRKSRVKKL